MKITEKSKLPHPFNLLNIINGLVFILMAWVFFKGGKDFLTPQNSNLGIFIPLGLLAFVSVFFGFISQNTESIARFQEIINNYREKFKAELIALAKRGPNIKEVDDFNDRLRKFEDYANLVRPSKWLYLCIYTNLIALIFSISNISPLIISSGLIHLSLLFTFFLVTSLASVHLSRSISTKR
ncbi:hypothetical protein HYZ97_02225 [Candidatus Pacearchaeota archaeon]|nr:hypothetical protein [Candidatus Pacearchaeota archaeon]